MHRLNPVEKAYRTARIIDEGIQALTEALSRGESEGLKEHLRAMARFSDYSFGNVMLIFSQCPEATQLEGYRGWQKRGRQVRKGEKGILIRAPLTIRNGEDREEERNESFVGFRCVHVFDVSQTEGEAVPGLATAQGTPGEQLAALKAYATAKGIGVETVEYLDCSGRSLGGKVLIRSGLAEAEEFSVLAHELAHEVLHHGTENGRMPNVVVRETEAEAVAAVVCHAAGLESAQASADYIRLYRGDAELLRESLERVQKTAREMIEGIGSEKNEGRAA